MDRYGYTLLEILIATTILLLGLTAVFGVTRSAQKYSAAAADLADAQLACQTKLNEILAQQSPIKPVPPQRIDRLPNWKISASVYPAPNPELFVLHIIAQKYNPNGDVNPHEIYQLLRWVPQNRVELPDENSNNNNNIMDGTNIFNDPFQ